MAIIEIRNLSFTYLGQSTPALRNVNLRIEAGELVLVSGPSGGGKSTLCRCINGLIPHFYEGTLEGEVLVDGLLTSTTPTYTLSQHVGMVFQNPQNQLFSLDVESDIAFALENLGLPREEISSRVDEVMRVMNIRELADRSPLELSGGQQQKVALASVLALRPKVIMLDEPTSFLDPVSSQHLINVVDSLRERLGLTIIIVEHRVDLIAPRASRLVVVHGGEVAYDGHPKGFFENYDAHLYGVTVPKLARLSQELAKRVPKWPGVILDVEGLERIVRMLASHRV
ncbi:MAG: ABC transporter ATP-binding protein [Nitrososphaerota archaeon]